MKPANLAPLLVLPFLLAAGQPGELGKPRHGQAESCWALERRSLVQLDAAETVTWLECRQAEEATVEALRRSDVTGAELAVCDGDVEEGTRGGDKHERGSSMAAE
ncbi:hypothetical protein GUITHDRAFT_121966 [Guillardia theta CCMP2712]|uniref:Uncharacterized protein n=1 Tax=Guillardia theta (strain CCMP2712) TaxID=905079 RepID=L1I7L4_GUITC|nr:hypothetical protein GUITHDRAFT_121966 [Guillardia theta CCMP2712]EKX31830.1 hypothetical protein GUITHDRAFT_121966 [Guillardia theta CCMP2712]|eukprot:XP_005818810.1 hypothetical protein GUITHDRAFT_121966 [Guillardia theta CCMP2712]